MRIGVEINDQATDALRAVEQAAKDMTPLMDAIGEAMVSTTIERFEAEVAPDGTPWAKSGRVLQEGGKTLQQSGELKDSTTHEPDSSSVMIGTNKIYAGVHQEGKTITPVSADYLSFNIGGRQIFAKEVTIPARPIYGVSDQDEQNIIELTGDYLGSFLQ